MSTYYEYKDVKVMIAHKLMSMDGWEVYGYHPDRSDSMTDYYDPAYWYGVAEKNGYVLCVDVYGAEKPQEIRKYNHDTFTYDKNIAEKIAKLEAMTVERGASEAEAESARLTIQRLQKKAEESEENRNKYTVTGIIPGHMAHPSRCNWHIEKDGVIIAKGNGILKYASVDSYYKYESNMKDYKRFKEIGADAWEKENAEYLFHHNGWYNTQEKAREGAKYNRENLEKDSKLIESFEKFINKLDTTCGGLLGEGDGTVYEKVIVTKYKDELKPVETTEGEIKEGQLFILKSDFNYGCRKGLVYRIHETEYKGEKSYHAYKLNGKYTKECTGSASHNNYWYIGSKNDDRFLKWIEKGSIAWCTLEEVKTPYEVEKVIKKKVSASKKTKKTETTKKAETPTTPIINVNNYTYTISEDIDTRTNERIYLVRVVEKLSHEEYMQVNKYIKSLGGYYSKFKHAFIFKDNPEEKLRAAANITIVEEDKTEKATTEATEKAIAYTVTEDIHTKTKEKIWLVKPVVKLDRTSFLQVKQKLAVINGYYSSFKGAFIFQYDPTEKINIL